jgi:hypothetical protein
MSSASVTVTDNTLTFPAQGNQALLQKQPGDLLVSGTGEGYLRSVVSVAQSGDSIIVNTGPASLDQAVIQGDAEVTNAQLAPSDMAQLGFNLGPNQFSVGGVTLGVNSASFAWNMQPNFKFHFDHGLKNFDMTLSGPMNMALDWSLGVNVPLSLTQEWPLAVPLVQHYYFQIGVVPVVVRVTVALNVGLQEQVDVPFTLSDTVSGSGPVSLGLHYANGEVSVDGSDGLAFNAGDPVLNVLSLTLGLKLFLHPSVAVDFYEIAGPVAESHEWLRVQGSPSSNACGLDVNYATFGGADADLVAELSILGHHIAQTPPLTVFSDELPISSGSFPSCP